MADNKTFSQSRIVIVQNFQPQVITKEILYKNFKGHGVKTILFNAKRNFATLEFDSERNAKQAMQVFNCKPILKKPIIMGFKNEGGAVAQLRQFHVVGLQNVDLNKIYRTAAKYGKSCKFSFNMGEKNKVVNRGYLSYLSLSTDQAEKLKNDLDAIGIKCEPYDRKKAKKVTIKVEKFTEDFKRQTSQMISRIKINEQKFKKILFERCKLDSKDFKISVTAFDKDQKNTLVCYISFDDAKKATQVLEILKKPQVAAGFDSKTPIVNIRISEQNQNYTNLITVGLTKKDKNQKDSEFEQELFKVFKQNFGGVLQVSLRTVRKKTQKPEQTTNAENKYMAFINLESQDFGKQLIATYLTEKKKVLLKRFYINQPFVNLFCSTNFKKDFRKARLNYKKIQKDIKTSNDAIKKEQIQNKTTSRNPQAQKPFSYPSMPMSMNPINPGMMQIPRMMPGGPGMGMIPPPNMPNMGLPSGMGGMGMNMGMGMGGMNMGGMGMGGMGMGGMGPSTLPNQPPNFIPQNPIQSINNQAPLNPADIRMRRNEFLRQKQVFLQRQPAFLKRIMVVHMKGILDEIGFSQQSAIYANIILKNEEPKQLFYFLQNPEELRKYAENIKL